MLREEVLDLLVEAQGSYVSGENISQRFQLTRAAVWKQIQALKEAGYKIEAQTKNGYRLAGTPLSLDKWALKHKLQTKELGHPFYIRDEIPSTNDWAKDEARQGGQHGLALLAKKQTAGRGRLQRYWESPIGGLWLSVILCPNLSLADAAKLTLSTSVAVVDTLKELYSLDVGIKWPNDVLFQGQKVVGILGEVVGEWNTVQTMILGIGINANLSRESLSGGAAATSLKEILGREVDLNELAASLLKHLELELQAFEKEGFARLRERWLARALGLGSPVVVTRGEQSYEGIFKGLSDDGELLLNTGERELVFSAGEVSLRSLTGGYFTS